MTYQRCRNKELPGDYSLIFFLGQEAGSVKRHDPLTCKMAPGPSAQITTYTTRVLRLWVTLIPPEGKGSGRPPPSPSLV